MERYVDMKSPITGGRVKEIYTEEEQMFRGERYTVHSIYYICEDTGEEFTVDGQDSITLKDLYSQYRNKHGIPYPDEIKGLRERYGLNYKQITTILGFGENQYVQYEKGQVPSESNGKMIAAIKDKGVMLSMLEGSKGEFSEKEYERIKMSISESKAKTENNILDIMYRRVERSIYTGFTAFNSTKTMEMVRMFIGEADCFFASKLNKAMFYADFMFYKKYGKSISGMMYKAIDYGPIPYNYSTIYENSDGVTSVDVMAHDNLTQKYICSCCNKDVFLKEELEVLYTVCKKIKDMKTGQIVDLSHRELAWINHQKNRERIPYSEAFNLKFV